MKLKKEDVYIDLKGKSKDELTELYNFLNSFGEKQFKHSLGGFLTSLKDYNWGYYIYDLNFGWVLSHRPSNIEVTVDRLKKIIKPFKTQLENNTKVGDWCKFWDGDKDKFMISKLQKNSYNTYFASNKHFLNCEKITNVELIKLLENESK